MTPIVVGVGNAHLDRTFVVTSIPTSERGAFVVDRYDVPGGVEANVVTGLRRLGIDGGMISRLGDDDYATTVIESLRDSGIATDRIRRVAGDASSYCIVLRTEEGERVIVGGGNSTLRLRLTRDDLRYLAECRAVVTSGYAPAIALQTLAYRLPDGVGIVFDLAGGMDELRPRGFTRDILDSVLPRVDLFVGNTASVASYLDDPSDPVAGLREKGLRRGAVTAGADGATLFHGDHIEHVPAFQVDVVDTTGAGDAFTAGLVDAWLHRDRPLRDAGRFAAGAAALTCRTSGPQRGFPSRDAIESFLEGRKGD